MNETNGVPARRTIARWLAAAGITVSLVACGGGGDGRAGGSTSTLTIAGTVAAGSALAGATVTAACATGGASTTSLYDGRYSLAIVNGRGPCLLTAAKDNTLLHSITPGSGTANIVNLTGLTDMLVSYLAVRAGTTVGALLSNPNGRAILADPAAIADAQAAIVIQVKSEFGVSLTERDFLTTQIQTPQSGVQNGADKDLEVLKAGLAIDENGAPSAKASTAVNSAAKQAPPYVAPTGATG
jgi:hypothetical protein